MQILSFLCRAALASLLFGASSLAAADRPASSCAADGATFYVCGVVNAEDMVILAGSTYILAGNLVGRHPVDAGGFHLIDTRSGTARRLAPDFSGPAVPAYAACGGPPPADRFAAHGLSIRKIGNRRYHVLAVNHGGRESVESFELDLTRASPAMRWQGCVVAQADVMANAVAHLGKDELVLTSFGDRSDPDGFRKLGAGELIGFADRWNATAGWTRVAGSALAGTNGVASSPDGKLIYLTGWGDSSLHIISIDAERPPRRIALPDMRADNIRIDDDGALIITGQRAPPADVLACSSRRPDPCLLPFRVVRVDAKTMVAKIWLDAPASKTFGAASVAVRRDNQLWIGSFQSDRVSRVSL